MEQTDPTVESILNRNKRVEAEKAWETSLTRRAFIAVITYLTATLFQWLIETPNFAINALVPTGGYLLSTLSLPPLKRWWLRKHQP